MPIVGICHGAKKPIVSWDRNVEFATRRNDTQDAPLRLRLRRWVVQTACAEVAGRIRAYQSDDLQESPEDETNGEKDCHDE